MAFLNYKNKKNREKPAAAATSSQARADESCLTTDLVKKNSNVCSKRVSFIQEIKTPEPSREIASISQTPRALKITQECIAASMTREAGGDGYICGATKRARPYGKAHGNTLQCVNDDMADYLTFAVNSAIQCMSSIGPTSEETNPIDSRVIYKKINNETAFNPSLAASIGVGVGQLTTWAVKDIAKKNGNGRYILEKIAESKKQECQGFKKVAVKDLKKRPTVQETCAWVSPGDGLARSLIYSVGYYLTLRDQYIIPALKKRSASHLINNTTLVSDLTAIAYGHEGLKQAKLLMDKFRTNEKTKAQDLQRKIRSKSDYLQKIQGKMREIACIRNGKDPNRKNCKNANIPNADLEGDTCVSK